MDDLQYRFLERYNAAQAHYRVSLSKLKKSQDRMLAHFLGLTENERIARILTVRTIQQGSDILEYELKKDITTIVMDFVMEARKDPNRELAPEIVVILSLLPPFYEHREDDKIVCFYNGNTIGHTKR